MKYTCRLCGFTTDLKSQIHKHHIKPREAGGSNSEWNLISVCPTCHSLIYSPYAKNGIHSKCGEKSIELIGWRDSTAGKLIEIRINGEIFYK